MKKRSNILLLILLLMSQAVSAQKFTIESMQATNDLSAGTYITNACIQKRSDLQIRPSERSFSLLGNYISSARRRPHDDSEDVGPVYKEYLRI